jgi:hypothetical protein
MRQVIAWLAGDTRSRVFKRQSRESNRQYFRRYPQSRFGPRIGRRSQNAAGFRPAFQQRD